MPGALSAGQVTFFVVYCWTFCTWSYTQFLLYLRGRDGDEHQTHEMDQVTIPSNLDSFDRDRQRFNAQHLWHHGLMRCLMLNEQSLLRNRGTVQAMFELGSILSWFYVCDYSNVFSTGEKSYNRDQFLFLFIAITAVAIGYTRAPGKTPVLLNRTQTEEWKGWMQVLFLLYHYYEAREAYNAVRIFIAAYVWMTGYGNFCYYYKSKDFSIGRFSQMMWRLNFLVICVCVVMGNSYMLYYICPMHTIFTLMVYASLGIAPHLNSSHFWITVKLLVNVCVVLVLWDCKPVFYTLWWPLKGVMGYVDPRRPSTDVLHEWYFRSSLDRFVWIHGMLCAQLQPLLASALAHIDSLAPLPRRASHVTILLACAGGMYAWYTLVYTLPKLEYNMVHPYTSWIPITLWFIARNATPHLRLHSLRLYGWLGCITLETYISQFHIWLRTGIPDGQPKGLLVLLPGYPLLNFALTSGVYVLLSYRLSEVTGILKNVVLPVNNNQALLMNVVAISMVGAAAYLICCLVTDLLPSVFRG